MIDERIDEIIKTYESVVNVVDKKAIENKDRAYGGIIRSVKGWLQEHITEEVIKLAWGNIGGKNKNLEINSKKQKIPIQKIYIDKIKDKEIKEHIKKNITDYYYHISIDKQAFVNNHFVLGIECKAYTENAMIKRILVDFNLLKTILPPITCYLFQLESQLGGDYSKFNEITYGSRSTHTLMSYFQNVELNILTFLEGERKIDKPIHKHEYFKPLKKDKIKEAISLLSNDLKNYL